jgi:hypothetical protein
MPAKKGAVIVSHTHTRIHTRSYARELQMLYARRSAIDTLIQSLQDYDRFLAQSQDEAKRRLA